MKRSERQRQNKQQHWREQFRRVTREALAAGVTPAELVLAIYVEQEDVRCANQIED